MSNLEQFDFVKRPHGTCYAHKDLPVWLVHYTSTHISPAFWQGYIAIEPAKKGIHPCMGGVNNRRTGPERGHATAEEAATVAIAKATVATP